MSVPRARGDDPSRWIRIRSLSQRELAQFAGVEQPTMAEMLTRMDRDRIVERRPDTGRVLFGRPTDALSWLLQTARPHLRIKG